MDQKLSSNFRCACVPRLTPSGVDNILHARSSSGYQHSNSTMQHAPGMPEAFPPSHIWRSGPRSGCRPAHRQPAPPPWCSSCGGAQQQSSGRKACTRCLGSGPCDRAAGVVGELHASNVAQGGPRCDDARQLPRCKARYVSRTRGKRHKSELRTILKTPKGVVKGNSPAVAIAPPLTRLSDTGCSREVNEGLPRSSHRSSRGARRRNLMLRVTQQHFAKQWKWG